MIAVSTTSSSSSGIVSFIKTKS